MRDLLKNISFIVLIITSFFIFAHRKLITELQQSRDIVAENSSQAAGVVESATTSLKVASSTPSITTSTPPRATSTVPVIQKAKPLATKAKPAPAIAPTTSNGQRQIEPIQNPYPFPTLEPSALNSGTRDALVNIICLPGSGTGQGISGSGVVIDSRGVILTNAHVAQYVLLAQSGKVDLSCAVRMGSPATAQWRVATLYIPPIWVDQHAADLASNVHATGTGEHDYGLLYITGSLDGSNVSQFPYLQFDTRELIGFTQDQVLVGSYPAEFTNALSRSGFYSATSYTTIKQLMTFVTGSIDVYSLGGIIEAQNGSSGGAVVNLWGRLIGIVVTTSAGDTTGQRDLHALTLNYIDRDLTVQTGDNLATTLSANIAARANAFNNGIGTAMTQKLLNVLSH